jgi:hypothetical protein
VAKATKATAKRAQRRSRLWYSEQNFDVGSWNEIYYKDSESGSPLHTKWLDDVSNDATTIKGWVHPKTGWVHPGPPKK